MRSWAREQTPGGTITGRWGHGEICLPGEDKECGVMTPGGEAGGDCARDTRHGHPQRHASGRIPLREGWRRPGRTRGLVVPLTIGPGGDGGGGGDEGEVLLRQQPAVLEKCPGANQCGTRTGLSFAPAVFYRNSRGWHGRPCSQDLLPPPPLPLYGVLLLPGVLLSAQAAVRQNWGSLSTAAGTAWRFGESIVLILRPAGPPRPPLPQVQRLKGSSRRSVAPAHTTRWGVGPRVTVLRQRNLWQQGW